MAWNERGKVDYTMEHTSQRHWAAKLLGAYLIWNFDKYNTPDLYVPVCRLKYLRVNIQHTRTSNDANEWNRFDCLPQRFSGITDTKTRSVAWPQQRKHTLGASNEVDDYPMHVYHIITRYNSTKLS